ncbi:MAG: CoA transferase [Gemmataceae bacterium]|nr:CoA transferase [Gemmataceae bacterium]MCS7270458.1 CoA transferase [Gemmataceae bacterium]MDW8243979.1 CoA transferase [Thermogemmata sp.]
MLPFGSDAQPPLSGLRVVEAARVLAGPLCGQVLADLGAAVIKVERPGSGDETRDWGPPFLDPQRSAYFLACNRSKKSVTLDLHQPADRQIFDKLLARSDVLIENFRTDSLLRLDLEATRLLQRHPRLIVCSISGFGRTGPWRDVPGYDFAIQALSGLMSITGPPEGPPYKVGVAVTDVLTALYASTAILACLQARARSGHGYAIDLALHDCALAAQVNVAQSYLTSGQVPPRLGNAHLQIVPYQLFATADGYLVLAVGNDTQWQAFCRAADAPALASNPHYQTNHQRVERRTELVPQIAALLRQHSTAQWQQRLTAAGVPHAVVRDYAAIFADPQTLHRGLKLTVIDHTGQPIDLLGHPFHLLGAPTATPTPPPLLGQHNAEILASLNEPGD